MKCPQCERFFVDAAALMRHRQVAHHNVTHPCKCKQCGEVFPTWKDRHTHKQEVHNGDERIVHWQKDETEQELQVS
jgi:uncharacterized C2H2 Zn-finger protein